VRFGRRRFPLPLPLFLLWPLLLLAWLGLGFAWLVTAGRSRPAPLVAGVMALRVLNDLHGTRIDLRGRDADIDLQFI
jgi:hypothetical protein